jgi:hypothetical protein
LGGFGGGFLRFGAGSLSFGSNDASEAPAAADGAPTHNAPTPTTEQEHEEGREDAAEHEPRRAAPSHFWHHHGLSATLYKLAVWMHRMNKEHSHVFFVGDQHGVLLPVEECKQKRKNHDDNDMFDPAEALLVDSYPSLDLTLPESSSSSSSDSECSRRSGGDRHHDRDPDDVAMDENDNDNNDEMGSSTSTSSSMSLSSSENDDYNDDYNDDGWAWEEKDQNNNNNNSNDSDYFGDLERGGRSSGIVDDDEDDDEDDEDDDAFEYDEEGVEVYYSKYGKYGLKAADLTSTSFSSDEEEEEEIHHLARLYRQRHGLSSTSSSSAVVPSSFPKSHHPPRSEQACKVPQQPTLRSRRPARPRHRHRRRRSSSRGGRHRPRDGRAHSKEEGIPTHHDSIQAPTAAEPGRPVAPAATRPMTRAHQDHSYLYISDPEDSDEHHHQQDAAFLPTDGIESTVQPNLRNRMSTPTLPPCFWPALSTWLRPQQPTFVVSLSPPAPTS